MPKKATRTTKSAPAAPAKTTVKEKLGNIVAKGKDFGKTVAEKAKSAGTAAKTAGIKAASHVSRNKAAYIAGGLGAAAGAAGMAAANRKKQSQGEG